MKKLAFLLPFLALATASHGALMLDFGPTTVTGTNLTNSPLHTADANFTGTSWNKVELADNPSGLVYSDGSAATGVSVNLGRNSTTNTTINLASQPASSSALGTATNTGVYAGTSVGTDGIFGTTTTNPVIGFQLGGLSAGVYEIYITARNTNTGNNQAAYSQTVFLGKSTTAGNFDYSGYTSLSLAYPTGATSANFATSAWVEGQNYLKFSISLAANEYMNLAIAGSGTASGADRGFLNSVQIIPEPGSVLLFGMGAVWIVFRRRRS